MFPDLHSTRNSISSGRSSAAEALESCIAAAQSADCQHVFRLLDAQGARSRLQSLDAKRLPLSGLAVSIKDLFDVEGQVSAAGSTVLTDAPAAKVDCPAVARLRAAGASILGRTHMVEFAFSGVGVNPHFGTPAAFDARFGAIQGEARVPGGSSSGAGVSVATGAAFVGLGSDTGGSIRIPAALNGIVGFKSTARLVPTEGAVPLSSTLDTACAMTRSVRDAILVHEILSGTQVSRQAKQLSAWKLAVPKTLFFDGMDAGVARAFERTLSTLRSQGAQITEIDLPTTAQVAEVNATGGFSAAESYTWHRKLLADHAAQYDPRVRSRIERGAQMSAADYVQLLQDRQAWIARMHAQIDGFDALLSPTVPITAPTIASVAPANGQNAEQDQQRDAEFFRVNGLLLRNTSVINVLDGCALSLPCHQQGELPVGLMIWHGAMADDRVLNVSLEIEAALQGT